MAEEDSIGLSGRQRPGVTMKTRCGYDRQSLNGPANVRRDSYLRVGRENDPLVSPLLSAYFDFGPALKHRCIYMASPFTTH